MAYTVGQVEVDVFPNARGWDEKLGAQVNPAAEKVGKQLGERIAQQISDGIRKGLGDFPTGNPATEPSTTKGGEAGGAFGAAFKKRLQAALSDLPKVELDANSTDADRAIAKVRDELKALHDAKLGVDLSTEEALRRADALRARLDELRATSADIRVKVDTGAAAADLDRFLAEYRVKAEVAGEEQGGALSQGLHNSLVRNSPLIAAAVAGGLALGAPAVLAGAGILFGGIAAAAVHSNEQLKSAFSATGDAIKSTFTDAAQVTVPMFTNALSRIGLTVQLLGPQFHAAFAALGGPIDSLTTGLINMTRNAMPGLVSAVQNAGPVFQGLASLMASIGTGLGQFFQIIAQHSSAAGTAFAGLGSIVGALLPILGQLVGVGAELASQILPPLAAVLHGVASALNAVAPILPVVAAGFLAFKAISALSGPLETFAGKLSKLGTVGQAAGGALSKVGGALPAIGAAAGILGALFEASSQQVQKWGQALLDGGAAAEQASSQMRQINDAMTSGATGFALSISGGRDLANAFGVGTNAMKNAKQAADDLYKSMSPLEQKQQDVKKAEDDLQLAISKWGSTSGQAIAASQTYRDAQAALAVTQQQLSVATEGVSKAVTDAANAVLAATDSSFAYRDAQFRVADAEAGLATAIHDHTANSDQAARAGLALEEALNAQAEAAGRLASDSLPATATALQHSSAASAGTLAELIKLRDQMGSAFPASLQATITKLQETNVGLETVGAQHPTPTVSLDDGPFKGVFSTVQGMIGNLDGKHPTPTAGLNDAPFRFTLTGLQASLTGLAAARAYPTVGVNDQATVALSRISSLINGLHDKNIFITTYSRMVSSGPAGLGGATLPQANGGIVKMFAGGGFNPMSANVAQVVPPGTLRVIGDNPTSDEAYIPINNSARSLAVLAEANRRMNYPAATSGASGPASFTGNLYLDSGEFLGKVRGEAVAALGSLVGGTTNGLAYAGAGR